MNSLSWLSRIASSLGLSLPPSQSVLTQTTDGLVLSSALDLKVKKYLKNYDSTSLLVGVYREGESAFKGYGESPPDASSVFQIASVSKLLTTAILAVWSEQAGIPLSRSLEELIGDQIPLSAQAKGITLYQLATHTSGLPRVPQVLLDKIEAAVGRHHIMDNPYHHIDERDVFDYLATTEGMRPAGQFDYSNYGMGLLAHIMERLTGQSLQELAKEGLLQPLNMSNTGITIDDRIRPHLITGYDAQGNKTEPWTFNALAGAGAFYSTGQDMMAFIRANFQDSKLSASKLEDSQSIAARLQPMQFSQNGVNLGWVGPSITQKMFGKHSPLWHNGLLAGYASFLAIDPEHKISVLILSNQGRDVTSLGVDITKAVLQ